MAKKQKHLQRKKLLFDTCDRLSIPVVVAVRVLAGNLPETQLGDHPEAETWQGMYREEKADREAGGKALQELKHRQAQQLVATFGISLHAAFNILAGVNPAGFVNHKERYRQELEQKNLVKAQRHEEQKQTEALNRQRRLWLTSAKETLQQIGLSKRMIDHILPDRDAVDLTTLPADEAMRLWLQRIQTSGFATADDLLATGKQYGVWTVAELRQAIERQTRRANAGMLPEQCAALCTPDDLEDTLLKLFYLNHWAKSRDRLLYVDRQGLYQVKSRLIREMYANGQLHAVSYVSSDKPFEPFEGLVTDLAIDWFADVLPYSLEEHELTGRLARDLYGRALGRELTAADLQGDPDLEVVGSYIHRRLNELQAEAIATRWPIPVKELEALFLSPDAWLNGWPTGPEGTRPPSDWKDMDENHLRALDPEGESLIGFQYSSDSARYLFHLPLRIAQQFMAAEAIEWLHASSERSREAGEYYGRDITEMESLAYPIQILLEELGVAVDLVCPERLINRDEYIARHSFSRASRYLEDWWGDLDDDEAYSNEANIGEEDVFVNNVSECPLKCGFRMPQEARLEHWLEFHAEVETVTISQAAWLMGVTKKRFGKLNISPAFRNESGARCWKVQTLLRWIAQGS